MKTDTAPAMPADKVTGYGGGMQPPSPNICPLHQSRLEWRFFGQGRQGRGYLSSSEIEFRIEVSALMLFIR